MSPALPANWDSVLVTAALDEDRPIIRPTVKTAARDYRETGAFPIVDQSQNAIAGWTDNAAAVLRPARPVVVFGDHTRAFKYVDFPFATGADGTLVLNPSPEFEPHFFYFACLGLEIPARGYNRHYTMLKEMAVPKPPLDEQRKIAAVLGKVQAAVAVEGDLVRVARELKQAALRQLFTRGLRHEPQKQTALGPVPESWAVVEAGSLCHFSSGGTPDRGNPAYWTGSTIPWVKTGEVNYRTISEVEECITELGLQNSAAKLLPAGTLVMAMYGQGVTRGRVARLGIAATTNQACAAIAPRPDSGISTDFLYHFFEFNYEYLRSLGHGANQKNLNLEIIRQVSVPVPPEAEQREIAALLATLDAKIAHHEARQALLRELFRTLLHDLLTARRRVPESLALAP